MKDFSIYSFVTEVRKQHPELAPNELAKEVLTQLPAEHERAALEQALRLLVSGEITRNTANRPFLIPSAGLSSETPRDSARSWKTAASRRRWESYLEEPFHVIPGSKRWIAFGDCTADDLTTSALSRRDRAAALLTAAEALDEWVELLAQHGVRRVRDLPQEVLRHRLDRSAA